MGTYLTLSPEADLAIQRLVADYWLRVDDRDSEPAEHLFTQDCEFHLGNIVLRGHKELGAFFSKRRADYIAAGCTTRHLCTNFRAKALNPDRVLVSTSVLAMAGNGPWPIVTSLPSVADFEDICVRQDGRGWLFQSRIAKSVFLGPAAPQFARASPRQAAQSES